MYVTLKLDDKGCCRIHSVSDGNGEMVTDESYVVMPWKMVNVDGNRVSLKEAVDGIFSNQDELTNSTYVILKLDDKGRCKIHNVSDEDKEIVTNERYMVMPWKMVTRYGKSMTLKKVVDGIFSHKESEAKERERREREREEIEKKRKEYYDTHMKAETGRLKNLVHWYQFKLKEIREAPVDDRPRMLKKLYRCSEKNKHLGVAITRAGVINPVSYPEYPPELELPEYKSLDCVCPDPCGITRRTPFMTPQWPVRFLLDVNHLSIQWSRFKCS